MLAADAAAHGSGWAGEDKAAQPAEALQHLERQPQCPQTPPSADQDSPERGPAEVAAAGAGQQLEAAAAAAVEEAGDDSGDSGSGGEEGAAEPRPKGERRKREYTKWQPAEEEVFYATLRTVAGQKPEKVLAEISRQLPTKDFNQVRHYYYRLLKRLKQVLGQGHKLDSTNNLQVHKSMVKLWEVLQQNGKSGTRGLFSKPRERSSLSTGVQKGVQQVIRNAQRAEKRKAEKAAAAAAAEGAGPSGSGAGCQAAKRRRGQPRAAAGQEEPALSEHLMQAGASGSCGGGEEAGAGPTCSETDANDDRRSASHQPQQHLQQWGQGSGQRAAGGEVTEASQAAGGGGGAAAGGGGQQRQLRLPGLSSANSIRSSSQGASAAVLGVFSGKVSEKLMVRLLPWDAGMEAAVQGAGYNPFLELTCSSTKSLLSMLRHLSGKWARAVPAGGAHSILVHPAHDCPITLRGMKWGGPACDPQLKLGDIYLALQCPSPFQLLYSWDLPAPAPPLLPAGAVPVLPALAPELGAAPAAASLAQPGSFMQQLLEGPAGLDPLQLGSVPMLPTLPPALPQPPLAPMPVGFGLFGMPPPVADPPATAPKPKAKRARAKKPTKAAAAAAAAAAATEPAAAVGSIEELPEHSPQQEQQQPSAASEPPTSEARRPRGLLGLLQPSTNTAVALRVGKSPAAGKSKGKKGSKASSGGVGKPRQKGKGAQHSAAAAQLLSEPAEPLQGGAAGWQPQPQQMQQQHWLAEAGLNAQSLLNFLDAPTCQGLSRLPDFGTPGKTPGGHDGVPPLPDSDEFGLQGAWGCSPPSNFALPDGFGPGLLPKSKDAAGRLAAAEAAVGGEAGPSGAGALELQLGPTDFSQLFASMDVQQPAASGGGGGGAGGGPTAAALSAVDALLGNAAVVCAPGGPTTVAQPPAADGGGLLGERELEALTLSFGSLLGAGDSWLQGPGGAGGSKQQQQQALAAEPLSERPFAALFGK